MSPHLHEGACPGGTSQQLDPVHFGGGAAPPPPHGTFSLRQQTSMDPAEGPSRATIVIACPYLPPQACLLWMPMTPKVSQSPPLHPPHPRPCWRLGFMGVSCLSLQIRTALSTMVRTVSPPLFFSVPHIILCQAAHTRVTDSSQ